MNATPQAVSVKTAAAMYDISPELIYAAVNRGELEAKRIPPKKAGAVATAIRISVDALKTWFDSLGDVRESA